MLLLLMLLLLLVLLVKLFLFPKLVSMHVVVQISIDLLVFGGDDDVVQLVNLAISFGVAVLYHDLATIIKTSTTTPTLKPSLSQQPSAFPSQEPSLLQLGQPCLHCYYLLPCERVWSKKSEVEFLYYLFYLLLSTSTLDL